MSHRVGWVGAAALAAVSAGLAAGCGSSAGTSQDSSATASTTANASQPAGGDRGWNQGGSVQIPAPAADAGKGKTIAYLGFGKDNPYSQYMADAVEDEASQYGAKATYVGPPTFDPTAQSQLVNDIAATKKYDAIVMLPIDSPSIAPSVKQAIKAGVKVAAVNFPIGPDVTAKDLQVPGVTTEVREDVVDNAESMARGVVKACEGVNPCQVGVIWGVRALAFDKAKVAPFKAVLAQSPNVKLVCEADGNYTQADGRKQAAACLQAHPKVHVLATQADESTRGAQAAVKAAGKTYGLGKNDVVLIGSYASKYGVEQVRQGKWLQTFFVRPQSMARAAVDLLLESLQGKQVPTEVDQAQLDGVGDVVDAAALKKFPDLTAQWDG